ncbi:MAG: hypothetical protein AB1744_10570 [Candidatus Zixiibacteriota bacterium]
MVACGVDQYLRLEGRSLAIQKLVAHLERDLRAGDHCPYQVSPEPQRNPAIKPVVALAVRSTAGPVKVEIKDDVAWIVGGQHELAKLLEQMGSMADRGPQHFEILRVFDEGYEHIDASTHIDLVVK